MERGGTITFCLGARHTSHNFLLLPSFASQTYFFLRVEGQKNMYGDYSQLFGNHRDSWPRPEPTKLLIHKIAAKVM